MSEYDSTEDTKQHIARVGKLVHEVAGVRVPIRVGPFSTDAEATDVRQQVVDFLANEQT
jgi:hypothetical protein